MTDDEQELFLLLDDARVRRGCVRLEPDSTLTRAARDEAGDRVVSGKLAVTGESSAATGGREMSAKEAFARLEQRSPNTVFNCGLHEVGIGRQKADHKSRNLLCVVGLCARNVRVAWVADFG